MRFTNAIHQQQESLEGCRKLAESLAGEDNDKGAYRGRVSTLHGLPGAHGTAGGPQQGVGLFDKSELNNHIRLVVYHHQPQGAGDTSVSSTCCTPSPETGRTDDDLGGQVLLSAHKGVGTGHRLGQEVKGADERLLAHGLALHSEAPWARV